MAHFSFAKSNNFCVINLKEEIMEFVWVLPLSKSHLKLEFETKLARETLGHKYA